MTNRRSFLKKLGGIVGTAVVAPVLGKSIEKLDSFTEPAVTPEDTTEPNELINMARAPDGTVVVTGRNGEIMTSSDGITWTRRT